MQKRFSDRIGKRQISDSIQLESMNIELRNGLWNIFETLVFRPLLNGHYDSIKNTPYGDLFDTIWFSHFKEPLDQIPYNKYTLKEIFRNRYFKWDYLDVYDFFDFLLQSNALPFDKEEFIRAINFILERELSGYRVINEVLAPITNEIELKEIQNAVDNTESKKYIGANIHIEEALRKLSAKNNPDYRNSIKESISAVESICRVIAKKPKVELGAALKELKKTIPIHGALEQGFMKIYGYTSDGDGIRHSLMEESNLEQEDALFMLVASSAFINYLIAKENKTIK
jgi:hypothetical protein